MLSAHGTTPADAGTIDLTASPDGRNLYVRTGAAGDIDAYAINPDGSLSSLGNVSVPDGVGGEGIVVI